MSQIESSPVWLFHCRVDVARLGSLAAAFRLLPAGEKARAERFARETDRAHFVAAHLLLRAALRETGLLAPEIFPRNSHGKPLLPGGGADFNLTHTEGLVACAIARGCEVGLDAEARQRDLEWSKFARLVLAPAERALVEAAPASASQTFLRFWTLKEAVVKAAGLGLYQPLPDFTVSLDPPGLARTATALGDAARWRLAAPEISPDHWLALATRSPGTDGQERPVV